MDIIFVPLLRLITALINLYITGLFIYVVMNLLEQFGIINKYNQVVYFINNILFKLYEPALSRIRVFMPNLGGIDLSPLVLVFALYFIQEVLLRILIRFPA